MTTTIEIGKLTITIHSGVVRIEDDKENMLEITSESFKALIEELKLVYQIKNL